MHVFTEFNIKIIKYLVKLENQLKLEFLLQPSSSESKKPDLPKVVVQRCLVMQGAARLGSHWANIAISHSRSLHLKLLIWLAFDVGVPSMEIYVVPKGLRAFLGSRPEGSGEKKQESCWDL